MICLAIADNHKLEVFISKSYRAIHEQVTVDGIEGEFFENPCYMEFLMSWLMHTNLECVKNTNGELIATYYE